MREFGIAPVPGEELAIDRTAERCAYYGSKEWWWLLGRINVRADAWSRAEYLDGLHGGDVEVRPRTNRWSWCA